MQRTCISRLPYLGEPYDIISSYLEYLISSLIIEIARLSLERHMNRLRRILDTQFLFALEAYLLKITLQRSGLLSARPGLYRVFLNRLETRTMNPRYLEHISQLEPVDRNGLLKILLTAYLTFPEKEIKLHAQEILKFLTEIATKPSNLNISLDFSDLFSVILVKARSPTSIDFYAERIRSSATKGMKRIFVVGIGFMNSIVAQAAANAFCRKDCDYEMQVKEGFGVTCYRSGRPAKGATVYLRHRETRA